MTRRRLPAALAVAVAASLCVVVPSARADAGCDRQCKIAAANLYLESLVSHDASKVPLHDDAWRQENGGAVMRGGDKIRAANESAIMYVITGIHDLRWYVDGDDVMSVYLLDTVAPTFIFERFKVDDDGLIREIDAHFLTDVKGHAVGPDSVASNPQNRVDALTAANHGPAGPVPLTPSNTGDDEARAGDRAGVRDAVDAYLDAMASGDVGDAALAPSVVQTINRTPIDDVAANLAAESATINSIADRIMQIDGGEATVLYHVESADGRHYGASRLRVENGVIVEIESVCDAAYQSQFSPERITCA